MQPLTSATAAGVTLSFGILSVAVSVHGAVGEDDSRSMRTVCTHEHPATPVKQKLTCPVCEAQRNDAVDNALAAGDVKLVTELLATPLSSEFEKAREVGSGLVVIPEDIIAKEKEAAGEFKGHITLTVHPASEVSAVLMPSGKSYYLSMKKPTHPDKQSYTALSQLIASRPDLAFMTRFTLRSATSLFQLVVAGSGTLVLRQMADADLVRKHPSIDFLPDMDPRIGELVGLLAEQQTQPFLIAEHGTGKNNIIAEYANAQTPVAPASVDAPTSGGGNVLDLMSALEAAVAPAPEPTPVAPAKKATARKRTAKKAVAAVRKAS